MRKVSFFFPLKNCANCCKYLCLSFICKDKLPTGETLSPEELVALLIQDGLLMQSSGLQWLSCLFRSSFQVPNYFEVIGNYDEIQLENMKYSGFLFPLGFFFLLNPAMTQIPHQI